ncbi:hypothetical protein FRC10_010466, partial [Ceratobasidium sp. 414]
MTNNLHGPQGHPVYLSLGNISKTIRHRLTKQAMLVIGYIPVDSFEDVADEGTHRQYRSKLFHRSLKKIFEPLKTMLSEGTLAWCADGYLHHIYPIIASWVANWPEQNEVACTTETGCPKCMKPWQGRGNGGPRAPLRDPDTVLDALRAYQQTKSPAVLQPLHWKLVMLFWADIPHVDIGPSLMPDLLHQLYKGMFEHMQNWTESLLGTEEFNKRFKRMPSAQDLCWFKKGVTMVRNWAGRELRDMMRQFLPVILDAQAPPDFSRMTRTLLDFVCLANNARLTDIELAEMDKIVKYVQRLEALQFLYMAMDEYYGEQEGADEEEIEQARAMVKEDDGAEGEVNENSYVGSDENGDESSDKSGDEEEIALEQESAASAISGHVLSSSYGASDFLQALRVFLLAKTGEQPILLPSDCFDVWHKATFHHPPLLFAPSEPCHRDVVRVHPTVHDKAGRIKDASLFDTALFTADFDGFGLT